MAEASGDGDNVCPLCAEEMDLTDKQLKPCQCGYEICVWCWHHIMEMAEKDRRCPACREPYNKEKIVGMPVSCERLTDINFEKRHKYHKSKAKVAEARKHLSDVRVIQRNLVYVVGIPASLANEKNLERRDFFGQYGKILKVSISCSSSHSAQHSTTGMMSRVYITFMKEEDALRCIQAVDGYILVGQPLRACFGTTKYCHAWLKNMPCNNPDCLYLHDVGSEEDSFTKEELASKCGSKTQKSYDLTNPSQQHWGVCLPPPVVEVSLSGSASSNKVSKPLAPNTGSHAKTALASGTTGRSVVLPANASWGSHAAHEKSLPMRIPAVQGSPNPKSSSSHQLSVSPTLNLPALVVEAAASGVNSDHGKLLVNKGGESSPFISKKHNDTKHDAMFGTEIKSNSCVKTSAALKTDICTSAEALHGKNASLINLTMKCGTHEGSQSLLKNSSSNTHKGPSDLGSACIETAGSERTDAASVSSDIVCLGLSKDSFPSSVPRSNSVSQRNKEANVHELNKSSCMVSENYVKICPQRSPFKSRDKIRIKSSEDARYVNNYEECFAESQAESCCKAVASETEVPPFVDEVQIPEDDYRCKDHSLHENSVNTGFLNGDSDSIGITNLKVEEKPVSHAEKASAGSIINSENECLSDITDRSTRTGFQTPDKVDIVRNSNASSGELECLEKLGCDILPEVNMNDADGGEDSIISNILSMNFDTDDSSLNSPHNLAKLLAETDKCNGLSKEISSSWKSQNNKQSRFLFARSEGSIERSSHYSTPNLASSRQLQREWENGKYFLESTNEPDQLNINRLSNNAFTPNMQGFQSISEGSTFLIPSEAIAMQPPVSRTLHSAPPGFSVPSRAHSIPPPGFLLQTKAERPVECGITAVSKNGGEACENSVSLSNMTWSACSQPYTLGTDNDVEFFDPAIMAVGKEKLSLGPSCPGRAISDSSSGSLQQSVSNVNGSNALYGFGQPFVRQLNLVDYDGRLELLKQRACYTNSYLASSRQQLMCSDHVGDAFTSCVSSKKDVILPSRFLEPTQTNLINSQFSQVPFQQHANALFRSPSERNGWNNMSILSSGVEPQLVVGRSEPSLVEITNNERYGCMDPRFGPTKMFSNSIYNDSKFNKPSLGDLYSQIYM